MTDSVHRAEVEAVQTFGELQEWFDKDVYAKLAPLVNSRTWSFDPRTYCLSQPGDRTFSNNTPWCHSKGHPSMWCTFDHHVAFDLYNIIPPRCLKCWKVTATVDSFEQAIELEKAQLSEPDVPSKLGMEVRPYTSKSFGAYWYTNSIEEGRDRLEQVRKLVSKNVPRGKKMAKGLILKRGCTEYEFLKGPSPFWAMTKKEEEMYEFLMTHVNFEKTISPQPEFIKNNIRQRWAQWAHSVGDMSYMKWNDGKPLYPGYVQYQDGDIEGIKEDIAAAQANRLNPNIGSEYTYAVIEQLNKLQEQTGQSAKPIIDSLYTLTDIPRINIGDHDELT